MLLSNDGRVTLAAGQCLACAAQEKSDLQLRSSSNSTGDSVAGIAAKRSSCSCMLSHRIKRHVCSTGASETLKELRKVAADPSKTLPFAVALKVTLPSPPPSIAEYAALCISEGLVAAAAAIFDDRILHPPAHLHRFMSGESHQALEFRDTSVSDFFILLFEEIARCASGNVQLSPTDLYHAHMFITVDRSENTEEVLVDFGLLFHAKEYPKEWKRSRWADWHPIGSVEAGGPDGDPRMGTLCSVKDVHYPLRNLLWLLSTNTLYQFDPSAEGFKVPISHDEFCTIATEAFDSYPLGDVNYFPSPSRGCEDDAKGAKQSSLLCCPRFGFGATLKMKQLASSSKLDQHEKVRLLCELVATLDDKEAAKVTTILKGSERDAVPGLHPHEGWKALCSRIPQEFHSTLTEALAARAVRRSQELARHNQKEKAQMLQNGVAEADADLMLQETACNGRFSEMRASNLLCLTKLRYRDAFFRDRFGEEEYSIEEAGAVLKEAVWLQNTFAALKLIRFEGLSRTEAVQKAIAAAEHETHRHLEAQLAQRLSQEDKNPCASL